MCVPCLCYAQAVFITRASNNKSLLKIANYLSLSSPIELGLDLGRFGLKESTKGFDNPVVYSLK